MKYTASIIMFFLIVFNCYTFFAFASNPSKEETIKFIQSKCNTSWVDVDPYYQTVYLKNCTLIVEFRENN